MPGLVLFNRRWGIGSDDLVFPVIVESTFRLAWLIAISVVFHINKEAFACKSGHLLHIYFVGVITLITISVVLNIVVIHVSMKGTITNVAPRHRIPLLLYIKLAVLLPEVLWVVLGTYWAFGKSYDCERAVVWTVRGAVLFAWFAGVCMLVGVLLVVDPVGTHQNGLTIRMSDSSEIGAVSESGSTARKVWEMRCRLLCCCAGFKHDNKHAFINVAKLVADFFKDVDLVPTDIAAGLILIQHHQMCRQYQLTSVATDTSVDTSVVTSHRSEAAGHQPSSSHTCPTPENWMTVEMMAHFMKYALGSYGWPFYLYSNICTGLCKLATKCSCCNCLGRSDNVYFDNVCECHTAAIMKVTGIQDQDLIFVSFHNKFKEIPFYVAIDREHNSVVISIRGTLSLEDALVDMSVEGLTVPIEGVHDAFVHGAMLDCASYIKDRLESMQLLPKAFSTLPPCSRLVVVGHSLGAGVASILSILMKPTYPDLICFAYSPPGELMSACVCEHVRSYVCSVVVGKDLVPRLRLSTMDDLRNKILLALDECRLPKHRILATGFMKIACSCLTSCLNISTTSSLEEPLLGTRALASYSTTESVSAGREEALREGMYPKCEAQQWPLHPPGQILHIERVEGQCGEDPEFCASWAVPDDFKEILISSSMVLDHFPDVVMNALLQLNQSNYVPSARHRWETHVPT